MAKQTLHTLIALLFVISGATGLVYQVLWFKYLSLFLGNTTYAQTVVLAAFMGGLAIGAALWGRKADSSSGPLALYGVLEIGIGLYCLVYPWIIVLIKNGFFWAMTSMELQIDGGAVMTLRFVVSLLTLLPPTILMGGTLPILVKTVSESVEDSGRVVAVLYFLNSFGAVFGSVLCGFFFVRLLGLHTTIIASALVNILIGFGAIILSRTSGKNVRDTVAEVASHRATFSLPERRIAVAVAGISGMAAMIYEISWVRLLIPVFGSSTSSFSLMLASFITGITLGSWIVSKVLHRIKSLFSLLSLCQLGVVAGLCATLPLYGRIPYIFWHLSTMLAKNETTYPIFLSVEFAFGFLIMLVPTIFLGMSLPLATRIATSHKDRLGSSVGNVFSVNTVGTVVGALGAGLLIIPAVGVRHAIEAGMSLNLVAGLAILFTDSNRKFVTKIVTTGVIVIVIGLYGAAASDWNQLLTLSGVFRHVSERTPPPESYRQFVASVKDKKDLYYKEGTTATVAVVEAVAQGVRQKILLINGKGDASSVGDLSTQILLGQLPMMFHRQAESALVVGLGSGVTVGSILTHPVKSVECIEISPEVVEASKYFSSVNHNALADSRVSVYTEDALAFLHLTRKQYDVIVSEPSNPWIAGIGNLYTSEFFSSCKERLNHGGIMTQWFHIYEIDDDILKLVMRTFCSTFSHVTLWRTAANDIVFVGSDRQLGDDLALVQQKFSDEKVRADLSRILVFDIPTLLSVQMLSDAQCREYADYGDLNIEDRPRLEYASPRAFFINRGVPEFIAYDERSKNAGGALLLQTFAHEHPLTEKEQLAIGMLQASPWWGSPLLAYPYVKSYLRKYPNDLNAVRTLADLTERLGRMDESISYWNQLRLARADDPSVLAKYAWLSFAYRRPMENALAPVPPGESERLLRRCVSLTADSVDTYHIILGDLYFDDQRYAEASIEYLRAAELRRNHASDPHVGGDILFVKLAKALYYSGDNSRALEFAVQAASWNPDYEEAKTLVYKIVMKQSALLRKK